MRALIIGQSITNRDQRSIEKYLSEIARYDVLSPERELELFKQYKDGNQAALERLVHHNLRFVVSVAKQYQHLGVALGDLINEGNLGLLEAAKRFDHTKGFKFISYAVWWIRQSILLAINEKGRKIRVPSNVKGQNWKLYEARLAFVQREDREPTKEELASIMDMKPEAIDRCLRSALPIRSLDAPLEEEGRLKRIGVGG